MVPLIFLMLIQLSNGLSGVNDTAQTDSAVSTVSVFPATGNGSSASETIVPARGILGVLGSTLPARGFRGGIHAWKLNGASEGTGYGTETSSTKEADNESFAQSFSRLIRPGGKLYAMMQPGGVLHTVLKNYGRGGNDTISKIGNELQHAFFPIRVVRDNH
ncbi:hypothetical protein SNE40_015147 [Patella caerulea]|uniref:Uncharacterized protein n=1 Tax=Patella caerulea TaxID=87958 RepID=A0AAN8JJG9_PATCE